LEPPGASVTVVSWSPDGAWLAGGARGGAVWIWPVREPAPAIALATHAGDEITELAFAGADTLVSGSRDGDVHAFFLAARAGVLVETVPHLKGVTCARERCAWGSAQGGRITLREGDGRVRHLEGHEGPVRALAFAPDGARFASGGDDTVVR